MKVKYINYFKFFFLGDSSIFHLFIHLSIYPIIYLYNWTCEIFYTLVYNLILLFLLWPLGALQLAAVSLWHTPVILGFKKNCGEPFLTFWDYKILPVHLLCFLSHPQNLISPGNSVFSFWRMAWKLKIWVLGVLVATGVQCGIHFLFLWWLMKLGTFIYVY